MIRFLEVLFESEKLPESCGLAAKIPKQQKGENPNVIQVQLPHPVIVQRPWQFSAEPRPAHSQLWKGVATCFL